MDYNEGIDTITNARNLSLTDFRNSIQDLKINLNNYLSNIEHKTCNEKRWRLSHLKGQFESLQLHYLYEKYTQKINIGYFSEFLVLQIILSATHFVLVLIPNGADLAPVLPDLLLYALTALISVVFLLIADCFGKNDTKILKFFAIFAFILVFFANVFVPIYHHGMEGGDFRPAYTTHLILSTYIFFGVRNNVVAIVFGSFIAILHVITLVMVSYYDSPLLWQKILTDAIFLTCINGLGIYFRYMTEIVKRRSFLDRRACVESTLQLKFEKEQEYQLMSSIIPKHIIDNVREDILKYWDHIERMNQIPRQKPFDNPYVEVHDNVSILFADIVNYTETTNRLSINELLETLNELFGSFDDASEELKVLRIKFLGDCYYCVAGIPPDPAPNHAEACVDLGLKMISIISDVRRKRKLQVNMRIGVHTGKIVSGIIGSIKWQYDIWSNDVDIANKMESEGCAGKVHITENTRKLLKKDYDLEATDKGDNVPLFKQNNIKTYLISPKWDSTDTTSKQIVESTENTTNQRRSTVYIKRTSNLAKNSIILENNVQNDDDISTAKILANLANERRTSGNPALANVYKRFNSKILNERRLSPLDGKRRTAFMNNNIKRYEERLKETNDELEKSIDDLLLTKYEQWFKLSQINSCLLSFRNWKNEWNFIHMPDPLFKYYLICEIILIILVFIIENLAIPRWDWTSWIFFITIALMTLIIIPLTWTYYFWTRHIAKNDYSKPNNRLIRFFYEQSQFITNNSHARLLIYTVVCALFSACIFSKTIECKVINHETMNDTRTKIKTYFIWDLVSDNINETDCIIPWHMTETCGLAIIMVFIFLRMYLWVKFLYAFAISGIYVYCIWQFNERFFHGDETFNYLLKPQVAHTLSIIFLTFTLHLIDRQTEYMNKLDYSWYETLIKEEGKANSVHIINNMLLKNILPIHVAELYLDVNRKNRSSTDLYHEEYDSVAVMFASIVNYSSEVMPAEKFLEVMNNIICDFDTLLVGNTFGRPIEKIKIAKWTYMAACGLVPGLGNAENIRRDQINHAVIALIKFASCLMKKLKGFNAEAQQDFQLRIGVSYGPIVAGVVGSKKPLYDIWGDPVNMASRMDTTGIPNRIQVLDDTAEIIQEFGYVCNYRGKINVKGKESPLPTYFVALDDNFDLIRRENND